MHRIQGISDEFIPTIVDLDKLDEVIPVHDGDAILMAQTQRPVTQAALEEQAPAAAWKAIPSWLIYGELGVYEGSLGTPCDDM